MPLIDRYKDFPEGEIRDLLFHLDPYYQERLIIHVQQAPQPLCPIEQVKDLKISALLAHDKVEVCCEYDNGRPMMPADPWAQRILQRLTVLAQAEYDEMQQDIACDVLTRFQHGIETRKNDPHP